MTHKILKGITRSEGVAEGEALVSHQPISHFMYDIDNDTGIVNMANHELNGESVAGKNPGISFCNRTVGGFVGTIP